jgi:hypothetical protein
MIAVAIGINDIKNVTIKDRLYFIVFIALGMIYLFIYIIKNFYSKKN